MAAVAERIEAPVSAAEQLADLRRQIADRVAQRDLALRKQRECEADAVQHQSTIDRVPMFQAKLEELFERKATGDAKAAKEIEAVTKDVETMTEMAERAKLELHGCRAAARKFGQEAADAQARIDELRREYRPVAAAIACERKDTARAAYRIAAGRLFGAEGLECYAWSEAAAMFARDALGLRSSELLAADLHLEDYAGVLTIPTTITNSETLKGAYQEWWEFDLRQRFAQRVSEILAQLHSEFGLP